jgi:hypothetical protein
MNQRMGNVFESDLLMWTLSFYGIGRVALRENETGQSGGDAILPGSRNGGSSLRACLAYKRAFSPPNISS